jgi:hypothetical protein
MKVVAIEQLTVCPEERLRAVNAGLSALAAEEEQQVSRFGIDKDLFGHTGHVLRPGHPSCVHLVGLNSWLKVVPTMHAAFHVCPS